MDIDGLRCRFLVLISGVFDNVWICTFIWKFWLLNFNYFGSVIFPWEMAAHLKLWHCKIFTSFDECFCFCISEVLGLIQGNDRTTIAWNPNEVIYQHFKWRGGKLVINIYVHILCCAPLLEHWAQYVPVNTQVKKCCRTKRGWGGLLSCR